MDSIPNLDLTIIVLLAMIPVGLAGIIFEVMGKKIFSKFKNPEAVNSIASFSVIGLAVIMYFLFVTLYAFKMQLL